MPSRLVSITPARKSRAEIPGVAIGRLEAKRSAARPQATRFIRHSAYFETGQKDAAEACGTADLLLFAMLSGSGLQDRHDLVAVRIDNNDASVGQHEILVAFISRDDLDDTGWQPM